MTTDIPEGLEIDPVEGSPFLQEVELKECKNCGAGSTAIGVRGRARGLCPVCADAS